MGAKPVLYRDVKVRRPLGFLLLACECYILLRYGIGFLTNSSGLGGMLVCLAVGLAVPRRWLAWTLRLCALYLAYEAGVWFVVTHYGIDGSKLYDPLYGVVFPSGFLFAAIVLLVAAQLEDKGREQSTPDPKNRP